jgi:hypothetical protein
VYPGAPEVDDLIDHDCDDEESINNLGDKDVDEDGLTSLDGDCDDFDDQIHIDAIERCNGIDDNCDGYLPIDEWDLDNDGYVACVAFSPNTWLGDSYVIGGDDCDDNNAQSRPGLAENCYDGIDNDCNGIIDIDADGDGDGYTTCQGDCNDSDISIYPTNQELCNGIDDDCDGRVDEGFDNDLDGYMSCLACSDTYFTCDCDDSNALSHPNAPENCYDGIDNDCDGEVDQTGIDEDKDGWEVCDGDCDDNNKWRSPGTPERCNGIDDDCDNEIDNGYDKDGDGMTRCTGDCDDSNPSIYFGATEICNDVDENCDQSLGEGSDDDEDGWLNQDCGGEDCDDLNAAIGPDQVEICDDGLDNNCDQGVDTADIACDVHSGVYQGWFCGIQGTSPANWAWGLLALLVATRRRDPSFNSTP